jgi:hypothetical protein
VTTQTPQLALLAALVMALPPATAVADEVILDDLIVDGSVCVGADCQDGEEFDFDTIRLRATEPRIQFQDTSNSASFPSTDWEIVVNGDSSQLQVRDTSGNVTVLVLQASGGVALGAGSSVESDVITVGSASNKRRVRYVADGAEDSDAVTKSQLDAFSTALNSNFDAELDAEKTVLNNQISELEAQITQLEASLSQVQAICTP